MWNIQWRLNFCSECVYFRSDIKSLKDKAQKNYLEPKCDDTIQKFTNNLFSYRHCNVCNVFVYTNNELFFGKIMFNTKNVYKDPYIRSVYE